ncbi:hypothetical protein PPTG_13170 [Phytophthora nicotianae INRA-310]|uniref:Uncharacterized protein n=2 Tax=Phytophthora nicotianae TaxID=4792 RepID=W2PXY7_PHYN3|nr:hypothetical protein PPTG_13170 [Phytophthora nicotianae INRA-310]ETN05783.1 hypothetical protein PPTG_13170 [Phytophthora nicotianae INRA-310]ETO70968.1 hypothetical protein F444_12610 [Phytophthora nicotianae P1976]
MVWAELMETNSGPRQRAFDAEPKVCEEIEARIQQLQLSRRAGTPRLQNAMEGFRQAQILTQQADDICAQAYREFLAEQRFQRHHEQNDRTNALWQQLQDQVQSTPAPSNTTSTSNRPSTPEGVEVITIDSSGDERSCDEGAKA